MDKSNNESKYISTIVMSVLVIVFVIGYSMVSKATQSISEMESEKRDNQEQMSSYQEQASGLMETKGELESIVSQLNTELTDISEKISGIEQQINEKTAQLSQTKEQLDLATEDEKKQYSDMKLRIKYMYELNENSYMDVMLAGGTFSERLNKAEYLMELTKYDRKMLEKYKTIKLEREEKEKEYEEEQQELLELKEELSGQRQLLSQKISDTNAQILMYADSIEEAEKAALEYEKKVMANQQAIDDENRRIEESRIMEAESIERERRERESRERASYEESVRNAKSQENETTSPMDDGSGNLPGDYDDAGDNHDYVMQANDLEMLAALIECEAGDQTYFGMLCVGAVVVNRINSFSFPNTLFEVICQPYQFTPVTVSNRFALVLARGANATCYQAAREVLEQGNIVGPWLFFRMNDGSRQGEVIGDHVFY